MDATHANRREYASLLNEPRRQNKRLLVLLFGLVATNAMATFALVLFTRDRPVIRVETRTRVVDKDGSSVATTELYGPTDRMVRAHIVRTVECTYSLYTDRQAMNECDWVLAAHLSAPDESNESVDRGDANRVLRAHRTALYEEFGKVTHYARVQSLTSAGDDTWHVRWTLRTRAVSQKAVPGKTDDVVTHHAGTFRVHTVDLTTLSDEYLDRNEIGLFFFHADWAKEAL